MPKILFVVPYPIESATERYRLYQFLPFLEAAGFECTVRPFATTQLFRSVQEETLLPKILHLPYCTARRAIDICTISRYDVVVILREAFPFASPLVEEIILQRHPRVIFDFDDAIYVGHQQLNGAKYPWIYKLKYGPGVNAVLKACSHVIAGNRILADHALQFNPSVSIIPTVVDLSRYPFKPAARNDGPLTIGWVGSRSTSPYLLEIEPALRRLSEAHPGRIHFKLYGHPGRSLQLPNFVSLPFSLVSEIEDICKFDVGIMPLPDNVWTRGKCAFKAIQYMAAGVPVVASPVGMAAEVVQHETNGLWARTPDEWFECLNRLVIDGELRKRFAEEGRKTIALRYSLQPWVPNLIGLFRDVLARNVGVTSRASSSAAN